ncbi:MAG: serine hydrolase [Elusimicrobiota bacterium]|jgi:beta-lactamase class A
MRFLLGALLLALPASNAGARPPAPKSRRAHARTAAPPAAKAPVRVRYDVSYFRSADPAAVLERRRTLGEVFGSSLLKKLRIVRFEEGYALLYPRRGNEAGARQTAEGHGRVLSARGLGEALVVEHRDWIELPEREVRALAKKRPTPSPVMLPLPPAVSAPAAPSAPSTGTAAAAPFPSPALQAAATAPAPSSPMTTATPPAAPLPSHGREGGGEAAGGTDISTDLPAAVGGSSLAVVAASTAPAADTAPVAAFPAYTPEQRAAAVELRSRLESTLQQYIDQLRRMKRISSDEQTAWYVFDFTSGEKLVEINTDVKLQAASLIKPFIALAFMHEVREGRLAYDDDARRRFEKMIQHSSNIQTNWAMQKLGGPKEVERLLREHYGHVLKEIELVEYIPAGGRTYKNKASVADYGRFLFALWKDELPGAEEIKRLMALPKRDRLHTRTEVPDDAEVYSKTGSTSRLCGDIGVLSIQGPDGRRYAYAVIGIIEKKHSARNYFRWLRARGNIIREISSLVYRGVGTLHGIPSAQ